MIKYLPAYLIVILLIASCKKNEFVHEEQELISPCTCCELADSIEGVYLGNIMELQLLGSIPFPIFDTITDSTFTLTVTRVEDQQSNYIYDSTICSFIVSDFFSDTIHISGNSGSILPNQYNVQYFDNGLMKFGNREYAINGNVYPYYTWKFEGLKQ